MLETPCPTCGHLMDVNDDVCAGCGVARRRTRKTPWHRGKLVVVGIILLGGIFLGNVTADQMGGTTPEQIGNAYAVGNIVGLALGALAARLYYVWQTRRE